MLFGLNAVWPLHTDCYYSSCSHRENSNFWHHFWQAQTAMMNTLSEQSQISQPPCASGQPTLIDAIRFDSGLSFHAFSLCSHTDALYNLKQSSIAPCQFTSLVSGAGFPFPRTVFDSVRGGRHEFGMHQLHQGTGKALAPVDLLRLSSACKVSGSPRSGVSHSAGGINTALCGRSRACWSHCLHRSWRGSKGEH